MIHYTNDIMRKGKKRFTRKYFKKQYKKSIRHQLIKEFYALFQYDINNETAPILKLKEGDTLFIKSVSSEDFMDNDIYMQQGYANASAMILKLIKLSDDKYIRNSYINPAIFCFRQYLELTMKDSLLRFRQSRKASPGEANLEGHNLIKLWDNLTKYFYFDIIDDEVENIKKILYELNNIDKSGTLFRYNTSVTQGIRGKEQQRPIIDIDVLYIRVLQLWRFFEGINDLARNGEDEMSNN